MTSSQQFAWVALDLSMRRCDCAGCATYASALDSLGRGDFDAALLGVRQAVMRSPSHGPAWRSLAWLETANPASDYSLVLHAAKNALLSTTAAALCLKANRSVRSSLTKMYHDIEPEELCRSIKCREKQGLGQAEVAGLGLGPVLCAHPGMAFGPASGAMTSGEAYVDLVKRVVSGYHSNANASIPFDLWFRVSPDDVYGLTIGQSSSSNSDSRSPLSVTSVGSINAFAAAVEHICREGVAGDIIEAGVFRGGTLAVAAAQLRVSAQQHREGDCARKRLWAADTFEGVPYVLDRTDEVAGWPENSYAAPVETVKATLHKLGLQGGDAPTVTPVVGRFSESLRGWTQPLAVVRVDADTREGTLEALEALYPRCDLPM